MLPSRNRQFWSIRQSNWLNLDLCIAVDHLFQPGSNKCPQFPANVNKIKFSLAEFIKSTNIFIIDEPHLIWTRVQCDSSFKLGNIHFQPTKSKYDDYHVFTPTNRNNGMPLCLLVPLPYLLIPSPVQPAVHSSCIHPRHHSVLTAQSLFRSKKETLPSVFAQLLFKFLRNF